MSGGREALRLWCGSFPERLACCQESHKETSCGKNPVDIIFFITVDNDVIVVVFLTRLS